MYGMSTEPPNDQAHTLHEAPGSDCVERLVLRWPPKIRREIGEWLAGALCGHGSQMSKPAMRRWRYFLEKLEAQNVPAQRPPAKDV